MYTYLVWSLSISLSFPLCLFLSFPLSLFLSFILYSPFLFISFSLSPCLSLFILLYNDPLPLPFFYLFKNYTCHLSIIYWLNFTLDPRTGQNALGKCCDTLAPPPTLLIPGVIHKMLYHDILGSYMFPWTTFLSIYD